MVSKADRGSECCEDHHMSTLLPNVDDLVEALPETKQNADARELALAAAVAETPADLDRALATIVEGWLA